MRWEHTNRGTGASVTTTYYVPTYVPIIAAYTLARDGHKLTAASIETRMIALLGEHGMQYFRRELAKKRKGKPAENYARAVEACRREWPGVPFPHAED